jgi:uncharacterized membrane protein YukC
MSSTNNLLESLKGTITEKIAELIPKLSEITPAQTIIDKSIDLIQEKFKSYIYVGLGLYAFLVVLLIIIIYLVSRK